VATKFTETTSKQEAWRLSGGDDRRLTAHMSMRTNPKQLSRIALRADGAKRNATALAA
jgi:hypothetical protein